MRFKMFYLYSEYERSMISKRSKVFRVQGLNEGELKHETSGYLLLKSSVSGEKKCFS